MSDDNAKRAQEIRERLMTRSNVQMQPPHGDVDFILAAALDAAEQRGAEREREACAARMDEKAEKHDALRARQQPYGDGLIEHHIIAADSYRIGAAAIRARSET